MPPIASFEEERQPVSQAAQEPRGMSGWLVKKGLAKDEAAANVTLIAVVVVAMAVAIAAPFVFGKKGSTLPDKETIRQALTETVTAGPPKQRR